MDYLGFCLTTVLREHKGCLALLISSSPHASGLSSWISLEMGFMTLQSFEICL